MATEAKLFMFPGEDTVQFKCKISLCDVDLGGPCSKKIVCYLPLYLSTYDKANIALSSFGADTR